MKGGVLDKALASISKTGSMLPILWVLGVFAFFVRARLHLDYWPNAHVPDPKSLPFEFHHRIFMLFVYIIAASVFVLPIIWFWRFMRGHSSVHREFYFFALGLSLIGVIMAIPGVDFVTWFLD